MLKKYRFLFIIAICFFVISCDGDVSSIGKTMQKLNKNMWVEHKVPDTILDAFDSEGKLNTEGTLVDAIKEITSTGGTTAPDTEQIKNVVDTLSQLKEVDETTKQQVVDQLKNTPAGNEITIQKVINSMSPQNNTCFGELKCTVDTAVNQLIDFLDGGTTPESPNSTISSIASILNGTSQYRKLVPDGGKELIVGALDSVKEAMSLGEDKETKATVANVMAAAVVLDLLNGVTPDMNGVETLLAKDLKSSIENLEVLTGNDNISKAYDMMIDVALAYLQRKGGN